MIKHNHSRAKNRTPEYLAWVSMKQRCLNPKYQGSKYYISKGITVCDNWLNSFESFLADMGKRPSILHSLDRIDNNKGYSKENCRWATRAQQNRNQSKNRLYSAGGKTMIAEDWAKHFRVTQQTLSGHLKKKTFSEIYDHYTKKPDFS